MTGRAVLERAGLPAVGLRRLEGGDVSTVERSGDWVVKTRPGGPPGLFASEARGLERLAGAGVRVPAVRYVDPEGIVLAYLPPGPPDWEGLAAQLARLHGAREATYGLDAPVFIGPIELPARTGAALDVWREARMAPLLDAGSGVLGGLRSRVERMLARSTPPLEGPVWVHGDLWSGNVHMSAAGAALIDPSVWAGERAVDLAMMTLFGGFPPAFWEAYEARAPVPAEVRAWLPYWRLYFVLVHVVLFGAAYRSAVERELAAIDALPTRRAGLGVR
ncbi:MAG: fructosamine kinase family protein [Alphaproteobacteria bacterium]|nr:fructosamine kinase family protein [Alphaproteobacteria bacterium]